MNRSVNYWIKASVIISILTCVGMLTLAFLTEFARGGSSGAPLVLMLLVDAVAIGLSFFIGSLGRQHAGTQANPIRQKSRGSFNVSRSMHWTLTIWTVGLLLCGIWFLLNLSSADDSVTEGWSAIFVTMCVLTGFVWLVRKPNE